MIINDLVRKIYSKEEYRSIISMIFSEEIQASPSDSIPIVFTVREKQRDNRILFNAELIAGLGLTVKTSRGKTIMDLRLLGNSCKCMGKILHPAGATVYKVSYISAINYLFNSLISDRF